MRGTLERSVSMSSVMITGEEEGEQEEEQGKKTENKLVRVSVGKKHSQ